MFYRSYFPISLLSEPFHPYLSLLGIHHSMQHSRATHTKLYAKVLIFFARVLALHQYVRWHSTVKSNDNAQIALQSNAISIRASSSSSCRHQGNLIQCQPKLALCSNATNLKHPGFRTRECFWPVPVLSRWYRVNVQVNPVAVNLSHSSKLDSNVYCTQYTVVVSCEHLRERGKKRNANAYTYLSPSSLKAKSPSSRSRKR